MIIEFDVVKQNALVSNKYIYIYFTLFNNIRANTFQITTICYYNYRKCQKTTKEVLEKTESQVFMGTVVIKDTASVSMCFSKGSSSNLVFNIRRI